MPSDPIDLQSAFITPKSFDGVTTDNFDLLAVPAPTSDDGELLIAIDDGANFSDGDVGLIQTEDSSASGAVPAPTPEDGEFLITIDDGANFSSVDVGLILADDSGMIPVSAPDQISPFYFDVFGGNPFIGAATNLVDGTMARADNFVIAISTGADQGGMNS